MIKDFTFIKFKERDDISGVLLYGFLCIEMLPYLKTGYVGDDILNSLMKGDCINRSLHFGEMLVSNILYGMKRGRCFFLSEVLCYTVHYFVTNRIVYKLLIICMTLLSIKAAEKFICCHFQSKSAAKLFLILCAAYFPVFFAGANSLMMYQAFMQTEVILFFGSLYLLEKYLLEQKRHYLFWSVFLYGCSLFTYEISFLFILGIAAVSYGKKQISIIKHYSVPFGIGLLANIVCRYVSSNYFAQGLYDGVSVNIGNLGQMIKTFFIQFLGGISFYHYVIDAINGRSIQWICTASILAVCFFIVVMIAVYRKSFHKEETVNRQVCDEKVCLILGCLLWFGSAGLIAVTEKYQREILQSYHPHIPAYIEYFGMILIVLCICMRIQSTTINSSKRKYLLYCFVLLTGSWNHFFGTAHIKNYVEQTQAIYVRMPDAYAKAIKSGLLDQIDCSDTILIDISYAPVIYPNLFAFYLKKGQKAERLDLFVSKINKNKITSGIYYPQNTYITKYFANDNQTVVYLDKVDRIKLDEQLEKIVDIKTSCIFAWCQSNHEIEALYTTQNGQSHIVNLNSCFCKKDGSDYNIQTPEALYDYDSYTFWQ